MRWRIPLVVVLALFVAVSCDQQPVGPQADEAVATQLNFVHGNPVVHRASVGGADACGTPGCDANFSLIAMQKADGSVKGQWQDEFGMVWGTFATFGAAGLHIAVDCLYVEGNTAWISGVVTKSKHAPDEVGLGAYTQVVDNGPRELDLMSFSFVDSGLVCTDALDVGQFDLLFTPVNGQVRVW